MIQLLILQKRVTYDYDKSRSETIITYEYNDDNQIIQETEKNDKEEISKIIFGYNMNYLPIKLRRCNLRRWSSEYFHKMVQKYYFRIDLAN